MNKIVLWFVKITGFIPQIFYFRKKVYYVNKKTQSGRIKGKAIIVSNHKRLFDFVLLMYLFLGRDIYTIIGEQMYRKNKLFSWFLNKWLIQIYRQDLHHLFYLPAQQLEVLLHLTFV